MADHHPVISTLHRVVPAAPGKPTRHETAASQLASRTIAEDPSTWSVERARETVHRYTRLAETWDGERGSYRPLPLSDALARGGPFPAGLCVEVGCGTGLLTPLLTAVWPRTVSLDLTWAMLARSAAPARVLADASRVPLADGTAAAVVLADVPLFAEQVVRLLTADGVVVWSNALGEQAPGHVPLRIVLSALQRACGTPWSAVTAEAGWGLWAVLRRSPQPAAE